MRVINACIDNIISNIVIIHGNSNDIILLIAYHNIVFF